MIKEVAIKELKNQKLVKFVGSVNMRKGIRWLIKVLNELKEKMISLLNYIYLEEFLKKLELLIQQNLPYLHMATRKINQIYSTHFSSSIIYRGSAKCIYEAMNYSLPIICTEQSGSIVENAVNGFVINAGDSIGLKKALAFTF